MKRTQLVGIICMAILAFACNLVTGGVQERSQETTDDTFSVSRAPALNIDSFGGDIEVRAGESGTVRIVARRQARSEADLGRIAVNVDEHDGGLDVETHKPTTLQNASVDLQITAPPDARIEARTGGGNVQVVDLTGEIVVNTGGGNITIDGSTGDVNARTGGGDIDIDGPAGKVDASTGGGDVTIRGASSDVKVRTGGGNLRVEGARGNVDANTGGGNITIGDSDGTISVSTGGGEITVRSATGRITGSTGGGNISYEGRLEGDCQLDTGGGNITLDLPADSNVEVDLEVPRTCNDCEIRLSFDVDGQVTQRKVNGTIGSGGEGRLTARTGGGDIRLQKQ